MRRTAAIAAVMAIAIVAVSRTALAQTSSITVVADTTNVTFGGSVTLSGEVTPAVGGALISIVTPDGEQLETTTTAEDGTFDVTLSPDSNITIEARAGGASSAPLDIHVRPAIDLEISNLSLFETAAVTGRVAPPDGRVVVRISRPRGSPISRRADVAADGTFVVSFDVRDVGTYHASVTATHAGLDDARVASRRRRPPLPGLAGGDRGDAVAALERRLAELHYRLTRINDAYDRHTADAVMAFRKVQGLPREYSVDASVWRALADPMVPQPHLRHHGAHIEVDQTRQVLYVVDASGAISSIVQVSTGKAATPTADGRYKVYRKVAGLVGGGMYYPSYFHGPGAIHGYDHVPPYPASHGCVRIPYSDAHWMFALTPLRTTVLVYH